jgi:general secretion pathway protein G
MKKLGAGSREQGVKGASITISPGSSPACTRHSPPVTRHHARRTCGAFTLIELMVVVTVIAILAGLTLSTLGYVNRKGAMSRAQSEVAALSAAIDSYKLETGSYPTNKTALYSNLVLGSKVHFEPTPAILATNAGRVMFIDPWGKDYEYLNFTNYFELWSTAGGTNSTNWIRN